MAGSVGLIAVCAGTGVSHERPIRTGHWFHHLVDAAAVRAAPLAAPSPKVPAFAAKTPATGHTAAWLHSLTGYLFVLVLLHRFVALRNVFSSGWGAGTVLHPPLLRLCYAGSSR